MRIRTVKPEFWASESNGRLSRDARLLFVGLINLADDEGRLRGSVGFIAGALFPFDDDGRQVVKQGMAELERAGKLTRYSSNGDSYAFVTKFKDHQKVDKRFPSRLPDPAHSPPIPPDKLASPPDLSAPEVDMEVEGDMEQGSGSGKLLPLVSTIPVGITAPTTPPEHWTGDEFWRWAQAKREKAGFVAENPPSNLSKWWASARLAFTADEMQRAFYAFGDERHWLESKPALPFAAFQKQHPNFVPRRKAQ